MKTFLQVLLAIVLIASALAGDFAAAEKAGLIFSQDKKTLMGVSSRGIRSAVIPHGVTTIGVNAFYNCINLTSVTIPDSVITIEKCAFRGCEKLTSVTIPAKTKCANNTFPKNCKVIRK